MGRASRGFRGLGLLSIKESAKPVTLTCIPLLLLFSLPVSFIYLTLFHAPLSSSLISVSNMHPLFLYWISCCNFSFLSLLRTFLPSFPSACFTSFHVCFHSSFPYVCLLAFFFFLPTPFYFFSLTLAHTSSLLHLSLAHSRTHQHDM